MAFELLTEFLRQGVSRGVITMDDQDFSQDYSIADEQPLTLPHFDDESTLQSARPVVPLHEVKRASRVRRKLLLGGALFVAAVIGAGAASLIYDQRWQSNQETANSTADEEIPTSADVPAPVGEAGGAIINPEETVAIDSESAKVKGIDNEGPVASTPKTEREPARVEHARKPVEKAVPDSELRNRNDEEDFSFEELRQERRRERRWRRERRLEQRRGGDDTTRIREIFEGSPRP